ncbi:MAG: AraC family transcriptional regulator [Clostridia bacterium]|nr:AraC family transcriptional regulator [Clostridia bacterium]
MLDRKTICFPLSERLEIKYYVWNGPDEPEEQTQYPVHIHDFIEFYCLIDGDVSFMVEDTIYPLRPGDAIFCRPNEMHHCISHSDRAHRHACFWILSDSELLLGKFMQAPGAGGRLISPQSDDVRKKILQNVLDLDSAGDKSDLYSFSRIVSLLEMWSECVGPGGGSAELPEELKRILGDINGNLSEIRTVSHLTEKYHLSQFQLRRLFSAYLGMTPKTYLERRRLAFSRILLKKGATVTDACLESGFTDLSNYIRLFRSVFGITPSEYRRGLNVEVPNKYVGPREDA